MGKRKINVKLVNRRRKYVTIEAYKNLRTNLLYTEDLKVITITSTLPDEGKTVSAFKLSESFAELGKKVLLIDCDLRRSYLNRYVDITKDEIGLSEILTRQGMDVIYKTNIENLDIIISGKTPPNPSELLSNKIFETLLEIFREKYDYIIIDTPPISIAADAIITGRMSDGVIMVVRNDFVNKSAAKRAKLELERNNIRIVGVILNRVNKSQVDYKDYEYKKYY